MSFSHFKWDFFYFVYYFYFRLFLVIYNYNNLQIVLFNLFYFIVYMEKKN